MMVVGACCEEDELSMTVSDLSVRERRVSDRSGGADDSSAAGTDIDARLVPLVRRITWLEDQLAGAEREDREAESRCARLTSQIDKLWQELQEERRQRQASESLPSVPSEPSQAGSADVGKASTAAVDVASMAAGRRTTECLGVRLEALELHINARFEALEESCTRLQREGVAGIGQRIQEQFNTLQADWKRQFEEERHHAGERQQALARALGEELEASIVSQAVAEVRKAACIAAREEACAAAVAEVRTAGYAAAQQGAQQDARGEIAILQQKVLNLESRFNVSNLPSISAPSLPASQSEYGTDEDAPTEGMMGKGTGKGTMALQQFGESVVQLESNISNLLHSSIAARAEQNQQHTSLQREIDQLRCLVQKVACQDLVQVWEQFERLETLNRVGGENLHKDRIPTQRSGSHSPAPVIPHWRLAVVPSPARSPMPNGQGLPEQLSKGSGAASSASSVAVRVTSPSRHTTGTKSPQRPGSAHGGRRTPNMPGWGLGVEAEAAPRGRAVSPARFAALSMQTPAAWPIPGPRRNGGAS